MDNYKEKYEKALELAKQKRDFFKGMFKDYDFDKEFEDIFPELRESEDEKIRKDIIHIVKTYWGNQEDIREKYVSWLEKQGELNHTDKVEPKFKVGDKIVEDNEFGMVGGEITDIDNTHYELNDGSIYILISHQDNYKLVEEQKPANPAWSEEDEKMLMTIIHEIQASKREAKSDEYKTYDKLINWLKHLKPCWKPTEEQMIDLYYAAMQLSVTRPHLQSLYNDLKSL